MRGEYAYLTSGREFARERFSVDQKDNGTVIRAKVIGPAIGLNMSMELHCQPEGWPSQLALTCEHRGMSGTARYDFTNKSIVATVRSGGVERRLRAQLAQSCIVIPHPISAYRQFMRVAPETEVVICWIDVYTAGAFLRPRLRTVTARSGMCAGVQTVAAGEFNDLTHMSVSDSVSPYSMTGEGYLEQRGFPVRWRQADGDTCYELVYLTE